MTGPQPTEWPVPPGAATGVGSLPGLDMRVALDAVFEVMPDLPFLPELPDRGPGGALLGRTAAHLAELHVDLQPSGWRLVPRPGLDERRARALLEADLDDLESIAAGHQGPYKVQVGGPWTLLAGLELPRGECALADPGAVRDVLAAYPEGVERMCLDLLRRLPHARLLVQLDEPSLPDVLAGRLPTASGFGRLAAVAPPEAAAGLAETSRRLDELGLRVLAHCCGFPVPVQVFRQAGVAAVGFDATGAERVDPEPVGAWLEAGGRLFLGLVPRPAPDLPDPAAAAAPARRLWAELALPVERLAAAVVVTPGCGLAGVGFPEAIRALRRCAQVGRLLLESPEAAGPAQPGRPPRATPEESQ
jgi:hypothetical protein